MNFVSGGIVIIFALFYFIAFIVHWHRINREDREDRERFMRGFKGCLDEKDAFWRWTASRLQNELNTKKKGSKENG